MNTQYSKKELKLINFFGFKDLIEKDEFDTLDPPIIYRIMVEKAFCENLTGKEVESLRRCYNALIKCKVYRMTKEWDNLIDV